MLVVGAMAYWERDGGAPGVDGITRARSPLPLTIGRTSLPPRLGPPLLVSSLCLLLCSPCIISFHLIPRIQPQSFFSSCFDLPARRASRSPAMCVQCDVCGLEPAAVLCCADEAAFCSPCNRRVHRANKLAGKHRRLTLLQPDPAGDAAAAAAPLCDVCKERRGLVFCCVEDRAILCADCDEPIHSAKDLTAKHSRFLLVGARLSADPVDQEIPSPDESSDEHDDCSASAAEEAPAIHYVSQGSPCSSGRTSQPHRRGPPLLVTCSCAAPLGDAGFAREVARKQIGGVQARP